MSIALDPQVRVNTNKTGVNWSFRDIASLLVALVFTQAAFWVLVTAIVYLSPLNPQNLDQYRVLNLSVATAKSADDPTPITPFRANPTTQTLVTNPGLVQFSVIVKDPSMGIGVFIPRLADNAVLFVNGARLAPPRGDWGKKPSRTGVIGMLFEVPSTSLAPGINRFEIFVVRSCCRAFVASVYAGPLPQMRAIGSVANWLRVNLVWIIIATSILIGLVAASLLPLKRGRAFLWSVIACSFTVTIGTYFYIDTGNFISTPWRVWYGHVLGAVLGYLAFLSLVNAWTNGPNWIYRASIIIGSVAVIMTGVLVPFQQLDQIMLTVRILLVIVMIGAVLGVYILLWKYVQSKEVGRYWQAGLLLISSSAAIIDFVYALDFQIQPIYFVPFSNLTLMTAIGIALAQQGARLYLEAEAANKTLGARIEKKERELVDAASALRDQEAQTSTQTERARIMRDMHDGMGGQLLSLLIQTRDPETPREEIEQAVEAAIGDLRLLIDSLDSVGDSLDVALAIFRDRLLPRMRAAGVKIGWQNDLLTPTAGHSPSVILNVYRILQEAMANALRHSGASDVAISIAPSSTHGFIDIAVRDNGSGIARDASMGRGFANMRRRAGEIGGNLVVQSTDEGTLICLSVPA